MNTSYTTFGSRPSDRDIKRIHRRAAEMRAAYLRSLVSRLFAAGTGREPVEGGLAATR